MELEYYVLNVFSERDLAGGNQLAVFLNAVGLTYDQMLIITREMNFSESTFITAQTQESLSFKIFVPRGEAEYAGHPTIGTAFLDEFLHRKNESPRDSRHIILKGGELNVYYDEDLGVSYMEQLPVQAHGEFHDHEALIGAIGIEKDDLMSSDFPIFSPSSFKFLNIAVKDARIVEQLEPDFSSMQIVLGSSDYLVNVFAPRGIDGGDIHSRVFAPGSGVPEDPATGSAQGALMHALQYFNLLEGKSSIIIEQGYEMSRPSKLHNRIFYDDMEHITAIQTGGRCYLAAHGTLFLEH